MSHLGYMTLNGFQIKLYEILRVIVSGENLETVLR